MGRGGARRGRDGWGAVGSGDAREGGRSGNTAKGPAVNDPPPLTREAKALALLVEHPGWSNTKIAERVPCNRTTLYRWPRFMAARDQQEAARLERAKGMKKDGRVEAWRS